MITIDQIANKLNNQTEEDLLTSITKFENEQPHLACYINKNLLSILENGSEMSDEDLAEFIYLSNILNILLYKELNVSQN